MPATRPRSAPTRASASAPWPARRGSVSGPSKGQITVEGPFLDAGDSVLAVTGGTGDYAGARGDMVPRAIGTDGKAYSFTYKLK